MKRFFNLLSISGLLLSLGLLGATLYIKRPDARDFINQRIPWIKGFVGNIAPPVDVKVVQVATSTTQLPKKNELPAPQPSFTSPPAAAPHEEPSAAVVLANPFNLSKVCEDSARWPKNVRLKVPVEFPAVINGKVTGKLIAPAGAEARVVKVINAKVGVEYHGGGAWLDFENTDFVERAQLAWR